MSFANLGSPPGVKSKMRSYERAHDTFENNIKSRIEVLQDCSRSAKEEMDRLERGLSTTDFPAAVVNRDLDDLLARIQRNARETEQLFRDWTVQMAGEPAERHRKRFAFEKLQKAFEEETGHHNEIRSRASILQQRAASAVCPTAASTDSASPMPPNLASMSIAGSRATQGSARDIQNAGVAASLNESTVCANEDGLLMDLADGPSQDSVNLNLLSQEREEGIRRIQNQVSQVNQIFRDLASIVVEQGEQLSTIEGQADSAKESTEHAAQELQKTMKRQGSMRDRLLIFLVLVVMLMCFIVVPHLRPDAGMAGVPAPVKDVVKMSAEPALPMAPILPTRTDPARSEHRNEGRSGGAVSGFLTKGSGKVPALAPSRKALL